MFKYVICVKVKDNQKFEFFSNSKCHVVHVNVNVSGFGFVKNCLL